MKNHKTSLRSRKSKTIKPRLAPLKKCNSSEKFLKSKNFPPSPAGARLRPAYGPENQDSVHRSLIMTSHVVAEGFDLPQRGRMPLTLPWKGRCPTLNSDVGRMSCISSAARLVLWSLENAFSKVFGKGVQYSSIFPI